MKLFEVILSQEMMYMCYSNMQVQPQYLWWSSTVITATCYFQCSMGPAGTITTVSYSEIHVHTCKQRMCLPDTRLFLLPVYRLVAHHDRQEMRWKHLQRHYRSFLLEEQVVILYYPRLTCLHLATCFQLHVQFNKNVYYTLATLSYRYQRLASTSLVEKDLSSLPESSVEATA